MDSDGAAGGPPSRVGWGEALSPAFLPRALLVLLGVWLNAADSLVTATLMPSVARDFHAFSGFGLAVAGFLTGAIVAGASAGRLSERFGLAGGMAGAGLAYSLGCVASALASGLPLFVAGRILQGVGGGWVVGFCYVAIGQVFPERLWPRMFGLMSGVWGVASLLGPLVGGLFAAWGAWRGAFWMFAGQGAAFAALALALVPARPVPADRPAGAPWRTLAVLTAAVCGIAAAGVLTNLTACAAAGLAGLVLLAISIRVNALPGERLLPAEAMHPRALAGAGYLAIFALTGAGAVITVYGAALLQLFHHLSPVAAGYVIAAEAMGWSTAALFVSGAKRAAQPRLIQAGVSVAALGVSAFAILLGRAPLAAVVAAVTVQGVGYGLCWSLINARILRALPEADRAIGAAAVPTTQIIGGAVGAAAAGALANLLGLTGAFGLPAARTAEPWLFGAFVLPAAAGALAGFRLTRAAEG